MQTQQPTPVSTIPSPMRKSNVKLIVFACILGGLTFLAVIILAVYALVKAAAAPGEKAGEEFLFALGRGDVKTASSYLHDSMHAKMPDDELQAFSSQNQAYTKISWGAISVNSDMSGTVYKIEGNATTDSGCSSLYKLELLKVANSPKITSLDLSPNCPKPNTASAEPDQPAPAAPAVAAEPAAPAAPAMAGEPVANVYATPQRPEFFKFPTINAALKNDDGMNRSIKIRLQLKVANKEELKALNNFDVTNAIMQGFVAYLGTLSQRDAGSAATLEEGLLKSTQTSYAPGKIKDIVISEVTIQ